MLATENYTTDGVSRLQKPSNPWRKPTEAELNRAKRHFEPLQAIHENLLIAAQRGDLVTVDTYFLLYSQAISNTLAALGAVDHDHE